MPVCTPGALPANCAWVEPAGIWNVTVRPPVVNCTFGLSAPLLGANVSVMVPEWLTDTGYPRSGPAPAVWLARAKPAAPKSSLAAPVEDSPRAYRTASANTITCKFCCLFTFCWLRFNFFSFCFCRCFWSYFFNSYSYFFANCQQSLNFFECRIIQISVLCFGNVNAHFVVILLRKLIQIH